MSAGNECVSASRHRPSEDRRWYYYIENSENTCRSDAEGITAKLQRIERIEQDWSRDLERSDLQRTTF